MTLEKRELHLNLVDVWEYKISDAIEEYRELLDFSNMPPDDFKEECINYIIFCFDNEMFGSEINYRDIVSDTAKTYGIWIETEA